MLHNFKLLNNKYISNQTILYSKMKRNCLTKKKFAESWHR